MRIMKHLALAAVATAALALAGCGGGGGSSSGPTATNQPSLPPTTPTMPTPPPVSAVMIPDGMYLDDESAPMAGSMTIAAGASYTTNGVMFSCPAGGDACEVEVMADGSVTSTGGMATAMLTDAAMMQVAQAKKAAADKAAADAQEMKDRIIGKDRALETARNIGTEGGPTEAAILISRAAGAMASVTSTGYSMSDDPALPNGGWAGTHLTQTGGGNTDHLFVYTDIEPPTRVQFYDFDRVASTPALYTDTGLPSHTKPYGPADDITGLALDGTVANAPLNAATLDLSQFPAPGPVEEGDIIRNYRTLNADPGNTGANTHVSLPGNYNGAGGRYDCDPDGSTCSATVTPGGAYTLAGSWTFVPELNATAWRQDGEFMSFGWWLQEPTAQTGTYTFRSYADGTGYAAGGAILAAGSATYNGRAAGKYVVQEIDDTGVTGGMAGQFVAAASLTATFTGTGSAGRILGAISGFQSDNADVDVSGWMVTLNRQSFANGDGVTMSAQTDPTAAGFDGAAATMGDQTAHGTWGSQFFGQPTGNAYPLGVGGTFQADNEAGSIAGAFGARR